MSKPTCGPMYKEAIEKYGGTDMQARAFAAGFVSGQAEKVYLGACTAAMFRPSQDRFDGILEIVKDVTERYGLTFLTDIGIKKEIWICRRENAGQIDYLRGLVEGTSAWHHARARLCGIPDNEVDELFHVRNGHGARCD